MIQSHKVQGMTTCNLLCIMQKHFNSDWLYSTCTCLYNLARSIRFFPIICYNKSLTSVSVKKMILVHKSLILWHVVHKMSFSTMLRCWKLLPFCLRTFLGQQILLSYMILIFVGFFFNVINEPMHVLHINMKPTVTVKRILMPHTRPETISSCLVQGMFIKREFFIKLRTPFHVFCMLNHTFSFNEI
jgi:hypothetical protein